MTFLPTFVCGRWFYLYLILDLYSRKIVGFEVHERDDAEHAAHLVVEDPHLPQRLKLASCQP
jgi:transposase InsO family protein